MIYPIPTEYDKRARADAVHDRYMEDIRRERTDVLRLVDLWWDYYRERYIETGMEALTGKGAMYHFQDVGRDLLGATENLLGKLPWHKSRECPRDALRSAARTFGRRYKRGLDGVFFGLMEAGVATADIQALRRHCEAFEDEFRLRLHAAYIVNDRGQAPASAGEALAMFVDHMRGLFDWIAHAGWPSLLPELDRDLQRAAEYLRQVPDRYESRRKPIQKR